MLAEFRAEGLCLRQPEPEKAVLTPLADNVRADWIESLRRFRFNEMAQLDRAAVDLAVSPQLAPDFVTMLPE
jgi:hypothetical protein